jgi:hypothetical protein
MISEIACRERFQMARTAALMNSPLLGSPVLENAAAPGCESAIRTVWRSTS